MDEGEARKLLDLARDSIRHGLDFGRPLALKPDDPRSRELPSACFVSLHLGGDLRGCIGQTESLRPLAESIAENAFAAAFRDPRFPPLKHAELDRLSIEVHILTPLEPLPFGTLAELHARLRVGVDGLQLETLSRRGVFLPVMWEQLPAPAEFVRQLLRKAQIREAERFTASRFEAQMISAGPSP